MNNVLLDKIFDEWFLVETPISRGLLKALETLCEVFYGIGQNFHLQIFRSYLSSAVFIDYYPICLLMFILRKETKSGLIYATKGRYMRDALTVAPKLELCLS